jgi:hypothetical protein
MTATDSDKEMYELVERAGDRSQLEALRVLYTDRLHRRSNDFAATHGLRLVAAKLQRIPLASPLVTSSS